jgi:hypothetical protein
LLKNRIIFWVLGVIIKFLEPLLCMGTVGRRRNSSLLEPFFLDITKEKNLNGVHPFWKSTCNDVCLSSTCSNILLSKFLFNFRFMFMRKKRALPFHFSFPVHTLNTTCTG